MRLENFALIDNKLVVENRATMEVSAFKIQDGLEHKVLDQVSQGNFGKIRSIAREISSERYRDEPSLHRGFRTTLDGFIDNSQIEMNRGHLNDANQANQELTG